jgi:hypothetical protein
VLTKKDRATKSVRFHAEMIRVLRNWGDADKIKYGPLSGEQVEEIRRWCKNNSIGYTWCSEFTVENIEMFDGSTIKSVLIKHRTHNAKPMHEQVLGGVWCH